MPFGPSVALMLALSNPCAQAQQAYQQVGHQYATAQALVASAPVQVPLACTLFEASVNELNGYGNMLRVALENPKSISDREALFLGMRIERAFLETRIGADLCIQELLSQLEKPADTGLEIGAVDTAYENFRQNAKLCTRKNS
jgi:hypothetical protein